MSHRLRPALFALFVVSSALLAHAKLTVPSIFTDGSVLQRDKPVPVWGWTEPGSTVTVRFAGQTVMTKADTDGRWQAKLAALSTSREGRALEISAGTETKTIKDVLVGEVWILAGQSNMGWSLKESNGGDAAARRAQYPWLRTFQQFPLEGASETSQRDVKGGRWLTCTPTTASSILGVGFFFAEAIHPALGEDVPLALIHTPMGGTPIESWIDQPSLEATPAAKAGLKFFREGVATYREKKATWDANKSAWHKQVEVAKAAGQPEPEMAPALKKEPEGLKPHMLPSALFNGKIYPLQPFAARGVIWYQGETNAGSSASAVSYAELLDLLITRWRAGFDNPVLSFLVIQLPGYDIKSTTADWPALRASQAAVAARTPGVGLVVTIDLGEKDNIHPTDKQPVGKRAALMARRGVYGNREIVAEGPRFLKAERSGSKILLRFSHTGTLLTTNAAAPAGLEIAGADGKFSPIEPKLEGDALVVTPPGDLIPPLSLRYAWANWPAATISDASGLPLAPFQTPSL